MSCSNTTYILPLLSPTSDPLIPKVLTFYHAATSLVSEIRFILILFFTPLLSSRASTFLKYLINQKPTQEKVWLGELTVRP